MIVQFIWQNGFYMEWLTFPIMKIHQFCPSGIRHSFSGQTAGLPLTTWFAAIYPEFYAFNHLITFVSPDRSFHQIWIDKNRIIAYITMHSVYHSKYLFILTIP